MKRFWFNTGVRPENNPNLWGQQVWRNGTKQIPVDVEDVPNNSTFLYASDLPNLETDKKIIVRKILNPEKGILSKYAYIRIP